MIRAILTFALECRTFYVFSLRGSAVGFRRKKVKVNLRSAFKAFLKMNHVSARFRSLPTGAVPNHLQFQFVSKQTRRLSLLVRAKYYRYRFLRATSLFFAKRAPTSKKT